MDIAGEDRPVGAVLDFDAIGGDVDWGVAVVTLKGGDGLLLAHLRRRAAGKRECCKDDAS